MAMRILMTGGAGFIGSHLCERFLAEGHEVWCVDNFLTGREANVAPLARRPRFHLLRQDAARPLTAPPVVEQVLHLASPASPPDYLEHPIETLMIGSQGTWHALELARGCRARFLLASTSEVYGDPQVHPQPESYWGHVNPVGPRSVYDEAKRFAEALTMAAHRVHGVNTVIARIFNTYGPRMRPRDGRAIPNFITQALAGEPITLYGDGSQTRSFCYISDLVEGLVRLLASDTHEPVNLGNPTERSLRELAETIRRLTGSRSPIVARPLPTDDPQVRRPEISRARQLLHWEPIVPLDEGLRETIAWFRQAGSAASPT